MAISSPATQSHNLAVILKKSSQNDAEFVLVQQPRPPKFGDPEYDSHVDSDLFDFPSTQLKTKDNLRREIDATSRFAIKDTELYDGTFSLAKFDVVDALLTVLEQVCLGSDDVEEWRLWKYAEEPEFGPGQPVNTVFIMGYLVTAHRTLRESCIWMSTQSCMKWLVDVKPSINRVGPLAALGLLNDFMPSAKSKFSTLYYQEYPPGVMIIPMRSRTAKPFKMTNLVVFAPGEVSGDCMTNGFFLSGDALIVDPGCKSDNCGELMNIVTNLPRRLVIFVTHHHRDHVDGLSKVQKCNPDAILLAHEKTLCRIRKGDWSARTLSVSGGEEICINGQRLRIIHAPGHTDGHMTLLHVSTHSLIVGDHCVGQGSVLLDITSGGNMADYFHTTYNFMELSPHALIPMHGRINLWPKYLLCKYIKNRRSREASILEAIKNGAQTLYEIVQKVYPDVDLSLIVAASYNVRLHVEHLITQSDELPKEFSIQKFQQSCGVHFYIQWRVLYFLVKYVYTHVTSGLSSKCKTIRASSGIIAGLVAIFAVLYLVNSKLRFNY